jgi:plasmid replication initiation protein
MSEILDINNLIVVKHNRVIDAQYTMSTFEQRILLTCISKIDSTKELENNHVFIVTVDDILDLVDVPRASAYPNLKRACDALFENVVHIATPEDPDTKILKTRWVYGIGYVENKGMIKLRFTPEIMPFLTKLSRNFTKYKLAHVLKFKSNYSFRLYEWLCYWGGIEHVASVEWLRENLQLLDKYERMVDFKNNVIDVAVGEISATSNIKVTYEQIKKGRNIIALRFIYTIKHDKTTTKAEPEPLDLSKLESNQSQQSEKPVINFDFSQFNDKDKQLAKNALAKVPEATQRIILDMFKSALAKGGVKSPLHYLNSLVSKSLSGDLDTTAFDNVPTPSNHFEKQTRRADKIKQTFAKHTDEIKAKLADDGHIFIQGEGTVSKSEFEALGLIEKVSRKGDKSISLSDLMAKAEEQENLRKEKEIAQKKAKREKQPKTVADIPVVPLTEKQMAARQKILELEAQLIAAGEFVGINEKAISEDELAGLAELEAMQANLMKNFDKSK